MFDTALKTRIRELLAEHMPSARPIGSPTIASEQQKQWADHLRTVTDERLGSIRIAAEVTDDASLMALVEMEEMHRDLDRGLDQPWKL